MVIKSFFLDIHKKTAHELIKLMINTFVVHYDDKDKGTDQKPKFTAFCHTTLAGFHWPPPLDRCIKKSQTCEQLKVYKAKCFKKLAMHLNKRVK